MDWWEVAYYWWPIVLWLAVIGAGIWDRRQQRQGTIVCPTCGGAGRIRLVAPPPAAQAGAATDGS